MAFGFMKFFTPKDRVFYSLFEKMTSILVDMSEDFSKVLKIADVDDRRKALRSINDWEHACDEVTHQIFIELGRNFITPFDREDIHTLATALDDIADNIWGAAKRILNYNLDDVDDYMLRFSSIIQKSVSVLKLGITELRDMKEIKVLTDCCVQINSFENEADELLDAATQKLFSSGLPALDIVKKKDLYEDLEIVTDKCEDAANVIESIIIKYS